MPDLNTGHPALPDQGAPHETAAVLRMQRAGWPAPRIQGILKMRPAQLMSALQKALDDEGEASRRGCPIHDGQPKAKG